MAEAAPKPRTRAELEAAITDLEARRKLAVEAADTYKRAVVSAEEETKRIRAQFNDLKTRLATSEADNQRMRGYIARAQEDDVVREELVKTGDPAGEQQLVPKRKHTIFGEPYPYMVDQARDVHAGMGAYEVDRRSREKPRHWVTY